MGLISLESIYRVSYQVLIDLDVSNGDAEIIAGTILDAHKKGKHTHGIGRLPIYARKIREGLMSAETSLIEVRDFPVVSVLDSNNGFGQVAAFKGMEKCVEKAKTYGIGVVAIKDSNSFGVAGYYGELAAKNGMIGVVMGNASPALAPTGGNKALLGTNPICFAFPGTAANKHIIFDMACTSVARSKIRLAAKNGDKIPMDWARDKNGNPTDDPLMAIEGTINPIGGHKGFGLALVVDILSGLLSDSAFGGDVKALNAPTEPSKCGFFLAAINPEFFLSKEEYEDKMDHLIAQVKATGADTVLMPGENGYAYELAHPEMVEISDAVINEINKLVEILKIEEQLVGGAD